MLLREGRERRRRYGKEKREGRGGRSRGKKREGRKGEGRGKHSWKEGRGEVRETIDWKIRERG